MGIGIIVRDSTGKLVATASQSLSALPDLVVSEAIVALRAVEFSRNRGLEKIILEDDSLQVVNVVYTTGTHWSTYEQIVADIQGVLRTLQSWKVCHAKRGANLAAHRLAKEGLNHDTYQIWVDYISVSVHEIVLSEVLLGYLEP
jgi:hypothetical protein